MLKYKTDTFRTAYYALGLLAFVMLVGVVGYSVIEKMSFTQAFFMTIITMATVGFREVKPLSEVGMWFTAFLIVISFGIFAFAVTTFTKYLVDGVFRQHYRFTKLKRKIESLEGHVVICGFGRNGRQAASELLDHHVPVIIIEKEEKAINKIQEDSSLLYIQGNATHDEILKLVQLEKAKAIITTLPFDSDNLFVVLSAREINPSLKIISRASNEHTDRKLRRAGATNVIMPEKVGGQQMAKLVAQPDIIEFLDYIMLQSSNDVNLEEISCQVLAPCFIENSIEDLNLRGIAGVNIIGVKKEDGTYLFNPSPDLKISSKCQLFVLGTTKQINKLRQVLVQGV